MAGNSNYDGAFAFSVAKEMSKSWSSIWTVAWPLYSIIKGKKLTFNNAARSTDGTKMLLPVNYLGPATTARNETSSNYGTPITPNATQGFTQAEYFYAVFGNALYLNIQEYEQLVGPTNMIPVLPGKVKQLMNDFVKQVNTQLIANTQGTGFTGNSSLTGEAYVLSTTSNSPGNISQATYSTWQPQLNSNAGPFGENLIIAQQHAIKDRGQGDADFLQLSYASSNDVYGKLYSLIGSTQVLTREGSEADFGFKTFMYRGLECFMDGRLGDVFPGTMVVGSSNSWWLNMNSEQPIPARRDGTLRLPGTPTEEYYYTYTLCMGCDDPGRNAWITGIL